MPIVITIIIVITVLYVKLCDRYLWHDETLSLYIVVLLYEPSSCCLEIEPKLVILIED